MTTTQEEMEWSDDENCCPSEFGASDNEDAADPIWDNETTFGDPVLTKLEGAPLYSGRWNSLPPDILQKIMGYLAPTGYSYKDARVRPNRHWTLGEEDIVEIPNIPSDPIIPLKSGGNKSFKFLEPYPPEGSEEVAPQLLLVSKKMNNDLTESYFGNCTFPAIIEFMSFGALRTWGNRPNPIFRWHQTVLTPAMEYPLSFDSVKTLDLHIRLNENNREHLEQYKDGLYEIAQIFTPDLAPRRLRKLVLKIHVDGGAYQAFGGCRWDHGSPQNITRTIRELIEPFYVFSGEGNGEEGVGVEDPIFRTKRTVEVDINADGEDGWSGDIDEDPFEANPPRTYAAFIEQDQ